jgi:hypothetical protein
VWLLLRTCSDPVDRINEMTGPVCFCGSSVGFEECRQDGRLGNVLLPWAMSPLVEGIPFLAMQTGLHHVSRMRVDPEMLSLSGIPFSLCQRAFVYSSDLRSTAIEIQ